jgi:hypothetical protein
LNLSGARITSLPSSIYRLINLRHLIITDDTLLIEPINIAPFTELLVEYVQNIQRINRIIIANRPHVLRNIANSIHFRRKKTAKLLAKPVEVITSNSAPTMRRRSKTARKSKRKLSAPTQRRLSKSSPHDKLADELAESKAELPPDVLKKITGYAGYDT